MVRLYCVIAFVVFTAVAAGMVIATEVPSKPALEYAPRPAPVTMLHTMQEVGGVKFDYTIAPDGSLTLTLTELDKDLLTEAFLLCAPNDLKVVEEFKQTVHAKVPQLTLTMRSKRDVNAQ